MRTLLAVFLACAAPAPANRLESASSPYLRRHAEDPVAWSPWDDAALARAKLEDKPIFLSIGYLSCHWCAVMHRESFLDGEVAARLNADYVAIKVDREERPDVDAAWLPVVRAATGTAGWPLTLVLAPDLTPIFASSYLPARDGERGFERGLLSILDETAGRWDGDRATLVGWGTEVAGRLRAGRGLGGSSGLPPATVCDDQRATILRAYDPMNGGFGRAAQFPQAAALERLADDPDPASRAALVRTLDRMAAGGLRDVVRGGFFRYTTDRAWKTPHFEKMLVDQAALARLYLVAAERVPERREAWRAIASETIDFVRRELKLGGAGYGTGLGAESGGAEGGLYLWTAGEVAALGVDPAGWGLGDTPSLPIGPPVPAAWRSASDVRPRPELDTKRVAAWNGMMLSALAIGGFTLDRPELLDEARALADALAGAPLPRTPEGAPGQLEDQALVGLGMLDLHAATGEARWLERATALYAAAGATFAADGGGWWRTGPAGFAPWGPERPVADGPEPSGTAATAELGLRLAGLGGEDPREVVLAFERVSDALRDPSFHHSSLCGASERLRRPPPELVLAVPPGADPGPMREAAAAGIGRGWTLARGGDPAVPIAADKEPIDGRPTAYLCSRGVCELPTTDPAAVRERLLRDHSGAKQ